jgi:methylmalonyl-CoA/ethylmalonyl-CoA epimerase
VPIIDHIGIAVNSIREAAPLYAAMLGQETSGFEEVNTEQVRVAFFGKGAGRIELLEATDPGSPVARFIDRQGPGLHHVCLRVPDLESALERAVEAGATLIEPGMRPGAHGTRVAFLHPRSTGGVLLELRESDPTAETQAASE